MRLRANITLIAIHVLINQQGRLRLPQSKSLPLIARHMRPDPAFFGKVKGVPWLLDVDGFEVHPVIA